MGRVHSSIVKKQFNSEHKTYDKEVRIVLPYYEEMHRKVIDAVSFSRKKRIEILELGIGTGETALGLLKKVPNASITGIDLSTKMMAVAKMRLKGFEKRVKFIEADMAEFSSRQKYDACISVLAIHHLDKKEKQKLFLKLHGALNQEGICVIGDLIIGNTRKEKSHFEHEWERHLAARLGEKGAKKWMALYRKEDMPDSISSQTAWLKKAGFRNARCLWHKGNCAVLWGKK
ncbi:MAG: methyltransferase domain-containing protein [Nanoarchaeota archaeon]|nr:methyltransferase domain-containing protein [Nanoarchaeota archaeon]